MFMPPRPTNTGGESNGDEKKAVRSATTPPYRKTIQAHEQEKRKGVNNHQHQHPPPKMDAVSRKHFESSVQFTGPRPRLTFDDLHAGPNRIIVGTGEVYPPHRGGPLNPVEVLPEINTETNFLQRLRPHDVLDGLVKVRPKT